MSKTKFKDCSSDELRALYRDLSRELFDINNELSLSRKLEKPHRLKAKKRERARVLTALHQKGGSI